MDTLLAAMQALPATTAQAPDGYKPVLASGPQPTTYMPKSSWDIFFSLVDAALPSVTSTSRATDHHNQLVLSDDEFDKLIKQTRSRLHDPPSEEDLIAFLEYRVSENADFRLDCQKTLYGAAARADVATVMNLLK